MNLKQSLNLFRHSEGLIIIRSEVKETEPNNPTNCSTEKRRAEQYREELLPFGRWRLEGKLVCSWLVTGRTRTSEVPSQDVTLSQTSQ